MDDGTTNDNTHIEATIAGRGAGRDSLEWIRMLLPERTWLV